MTALKLGILTRNFDGTECVKPVHIKKRGIERPFSHNEIQFPDFFCNGKGPLLAENMCPNNRPNTKTALIKPVNKQQKHARDTVMLERNTIKRWGEKKTSQKKTQRGKNSFYSMLNQSGKRSIIAA